MRVSPRDMLVLEGTASSSSASAAVIGAPTRWDTQDAFTSGTGVSSPRAPTVAAPEVVPAGSSLTAEPSFTQLVDALHAEVGTTAMAAHDPALVGALVEEICIARNLDPKGRAALLGTARAAVVADLTASHVQQAVTLQRYEQVVIPNLVARLEQALSARPPRSPSSGRWGEPVRLAQDKAIAELRQELEDAKADRRALAELGSTTGLWASTVQLDAALAGKERGSVSVQGVTHLQQGHNECGPTALAMVLGSFGVNVTKDQLRDTMTDGDLILGTSFGAMHDMAEAHGMDARQVNNATTDALIAVIDAGLTPIVEGAWPSKLEHYMVVVGYERGPDGALVAWKVMDPAAETGPTFVSAAKFERFWSRSDAMNLSYPGLDHYLLVMAPAGSELAQRLPPDSLDAKDALQIAAIQTLAQFAYIMRDVLWPFDASGHFIGVGAWLWIGIKRGLFTATDTGIDFGNAAPLLLGDALAQQVGGSVGDALGGLNHAIAGLLPSLPSLPRVDEPRSWLPPSPGDIFGGLF